MQNVKPVNTPLVAHFRLSYALSPQLDDDVHYMSRIPYSSAMGSLMYAMVCSCPDLSYVVNVVRRYMANPGKEHWKEVQWIFRYLRGFNDVRLHFGRTRNGVVRYVNSNFSSDLDKRRSLISYVLLLVVVLSV